MRERERYQIEGAKRRSYSHLYAHTCRIVESEKGGFGRE
jgi:hypothetical protein